MSSHSLQPSGVEMLLPLLKFTYNFMYSSLRNKIYNVIVSFLCVCQLSAVLVFYMVGMIAGNPLTLTMSMGMVRVSKIQPIPVPKHTLTPNPHGLLNP